MSTNCSWELLSNTALLKSPPLSCSWQSSKMWVCTTKHPINQARSPTTSKTTRKPWYYNLCLWSIIVSGYQILIQERIESGTYKGDRNRNAAVMFPLKPPQTQTQTNSSVSLRSDRGFVCTCPASEHARIEEVACQLLTQHSEHDLDERGRHCSRWLSFARTDSNSVSGSCSRLARSPDSKTTHFLYLDANHVCS